MRIGVIGVTSFLGRRLIDTILLGNKQAELVLFTSSNDFTYKKYSKVKYVKYYYPKILLNKSDLLDLDIIYFCSALGLEKRDDISDKSIIGINTFEPINLSMELEKENFSGKFVTFGSYFEIGQNEMVHKFSEEELAFSSRLLFNTYCLSKRMLTNFYSSKKNKINWFHFILPNFYGKGEKEFRLIPYLINAIANNEVINITEGKQIRQYLHVKDIVDLLLRLINEDFIPSIYNLVPNEFYTVADLTKIILDSSSKENIIFNKIKRYDENMKVIIADNSKIKNAFSWEPKITLNDGIINYNNL